MDKTPAAAQTVLISSRMDELGSSRRAAFRAVHDESWIPLLYETERDEWVAANLRTSNKEDAEALKTQIAALNEGLTINSLLRPADYFIGIYGTSLGDPKAQFHGLRPLEYELLLFLVAHVSLERQETDSLADLLKGNPSPTSTHAVRLRLREALKGIRSKSSPYSKVFRERVVLFLKQQPSDVPASSLMYYTIQRIRHSVSGRCIKTFKSDFTRIPKGVVYWRPSSRLYLQIRLQIQQWRRERGIGAKKDPRRRRYRLKIMTRENVGFIFNVTKAIFYAGYNVRALNLGIDENNNRAMYVEAVPYLHAGGDLVENLERYPYFVDVVSKKTTISPLPPKGSLWHLKVTVADRPGMLARALAPLAHSGMQVLRIQMKVKGRADIGARGPHNVIRAVFRESEEMRIKNWHVLGKEFSCDAQTAFDFIAADLSSQPGFYSVFLSKFVPKPHRRTRKAVKRGGHAKGRAGRKMA